MKCKITSLRYSALFTSMLLIFSSAHAQEYELEDLLSIEREVSVEVGNWSGQRPQFGMFDGGATDGAVAAVELDIKNRDNKTGIWSNISGTKLGQDGADLQIGYEKQGDYSAQFGYQNITYENPLTFNTGLQGIGTENQTISGTYGGAQAFTKRDVKLGTERDTYELGFSKIVDKYTSGSVTLRTEEKDGTRHWSMGGQAYFLTEPISARTHQLDLAINFGDAKNAVTVGYYGSAYENRYSLVNATNNAVAQVPTSANSANPASPQSVSLPLDNQAHQLHLNGRYTQSDSTQIYYKFKFGQATQNEDIPLATNLMPYGSIGAGQYGYVRNLNGKVTTGSAELMVLSKLSTKTDLSAKLKYEDVNDQTPRQQIIQTGTTTLTKVWNTPADYQYLTGSVQVNHALQSNSKLISSLDYKRTARNIPTGAYSVSVASSVVTDVVYVPYRKNLDDVDLNFKYQIQPNETTSASLAYIRSERTGSDYLEAEGEYENAMNPIHLADRSRDRLRASVDWSPNDTLNIQWISELSADRYDMRSVNAGDEPYRSQGMVNGSSAFMSIDSEYAITSDWKINGFMSIGGNRASMLNAYALNGGPYQYQKDTDLTELQQSIGLGLEGKVNSKLSLGSNLEWSRVKSKIHQRYGANLASEDTLADVVDKQTRLGVFVKYSPSKQHSFKFSYLKEIWKTNDWTYQFSTGNDFMYGSTTNSADGTTVIANPNQSSEYFGVRYTYQF